MLSSRLVTIEDSSQIFQVEILDTFQGRTNSYLRQKGKPYTSSNLRCIEVITIVSFKVIQPLLPMYSFVVVFKLVTR